LGPSVIGAGFVVADAVPVVVAVGVVVAVAVLLRR
jgi:hypothetical protein